MNPSDDKDGAAANGGTAPFRTATEASNAISEDENARQALKQRREIATQIFHFMGEPMPFLEEDPDKWIIAIMDRLRPAATHMKDPDVVRTALLKCGAAVIASIVELDSLSRQNGFIIAR